MGTNGHLNSACMRSEPPWWGPQVGLQLDQGRLHPTGTPSSEAPDHGSHRGRAKMAEAVELAALVGADLVDRALGVAAAAGRFGDGDLAAIVGHLAAGGADVAAVPVDESHSAQPGTSAWEEFGR